MSHCRVVVVSKLNDCLVPSKYNNFLFFAFKNFSKFFLKLLGCQENFKIQNKTGNFPHVADWFWDPWGARLLYNKRKIFGLPAGSNCRQSDRDRRKVWLEQNQDFRGQKKDRQRYCSRKIFLNSTVEGLSQILEKLCRKQKDCLSQQKYRLRQVKGICTFRGRMQTG